MVTNLTLSPLVVACVAKFIVCPLACGIITKSFSAISFAWPLSPIPNVWSALRPSNANLPVVFADAVCLFLNVYDPSVPTDLIPFWPKGKTNVLKLGSLSSATVPLSLISATPFCALLVSNSPSALLAVCAL